MNLELSNNELALLAELLADEAMRMDDDGNEGAFAASPLAPLLRKLATAQREAFAAERRAR